MFFPFSKRVWLSSLDENELVYGCLDWPRPTVADPPFPSGTRFPHIPVLVLDGLLDQATPLGDASKVAAAWPDATFVRVANSNHITAQADFLHCVSVIVRQFPWHGHCRRHLMCSPRACPVRRARLPNQRRQCTTSGTCWHFGPLDKRDRKAAWVATETIGDALERWFNLLGGPGHGLYEVPSTSGAYYSYGPLVLRFKSTRFVPDLKVSGTATWDRASSLLTAKLSLTGPHGLKGNLQIEWPTSEAGAIASEGGTISGQSVALEMPAPFSAHG